MVEQSLDRGYVCMSVMDIKSRKCSIRSCVYEHQMLSFQVSSLCRVGTINLRFKMSLIL